MLEQQLDEIRERLNVLEERLHVISDLCNTHLLRVEVLWNDRKKRKKKLGVPEDE